MLKDKHQTSPEGAPGFWNAERLAAYLGCCPGTISNYRKHGLPYIRPPGGRLVLFDPAAVAEWLRRAQRGEGQ